MRADFIQRCKSTFRASSLANTYRFQTSILAVNHEISCEALSILDSNDFIVVSYNWLQFEIHNHMAALTIVSESQADVARFTRHKLRLHLAVSKESYGYTTKTESFLMIAKDLPTLCTFVRWAFYTRRTAAKLITPFTKASGLETQICGARLERLGTKSQVDHQNSISRQRADGTEPGPREVYALLA